MTFRSMHVFGTCKDQVAAQRCWLARKQKRLDVMFVGNWSCRGHCAASFVSQVLSHVHRSNSMSFTNWNQKLPWNSPGVCSSKYGISFRLIFNRYSIQTHFSFCRWKHKSLFWSQTTLFSSCQIRLLIAFKSLLVSSTFCFYIFYILWKSFCNHYSWLLKSLSSPKIRWLVCHSSPNFHVESFLKTIFHRWHDIMSTVCINSYHNHLTYVMMEIFRETPNNEVHSRIRGFSARGISSQKGRDWPKPRGRLCHATM